MASSLTPLRMALLTNQRYPSTQKKSCFYGNAVYMFTKIRDWTIFWINRILSTPLHTISLKYVLIFGMFQNLYLGPKIVVSFGRFWKRCTHISHLYPACYRPASLVI